jgi:transcriptional regulator with XRE-family HTH domain
MNPDRLGRVLRVLRVRNELTQAALAARAGVTRQAVSELETGRGARLRLRTVGAIVGGLDARLDVRVFWHGPELDRLLDAGHAAMTASVKRRLEHWGWQVRIEVSFNRYGERGRIDLLAWHAVSAALVVLEIKTALVDLQDLLGTLDVKTRLARTVVQPFGWQPRVVIPAIAFAENRTTRERIRRLGTMFDRFDVRGRAALSWLRRPHREPAPTGLLWLTGADGTLPPRLGASRVRPRRAGR